MAARERGAVILWGSSFEGDWHPPYGPWVEALGDLIRSLDPGRLRQALGRGGPVMARLVPELDAMLGEGPQVAALSPEADQVACCGHARRRLTVCQWRMRNPRRRAAMRWCQVVTCVREMTIGIAWSSCCGLPRVMAG